MAPRKMNKSVATGVPTPSVEVVPTPALVESPAPVTGSALDRPAKEVLSKDQPSMTFVYALVPFAGSLTDEETKASNLSCVSECAETSKIFFNLATSFLDAEPELTLGALLAKIEPIMDWKRCIRLMNKILDLVPKAQEAVKTQDVIDTLQPTVTLEKMGGQTAPLPAEPEYIRDLKLGLDPDKLAKKIREDPACLAAIEKEIGLAGLPTPARTVETCWRCLKAKKGSYEAIPDTLKKKDPKAYEELAIYAIEHGLGLPRWIDEATPLSIEKAALKKKPTLSLYFHKDKAREAAAQAYAFTECGALWPSSLYRDQPTWATRSMARRAFAEGRFESLWNLPIDVIPDQTIMAECQKPASRLGSMDRLPMDHLKADMWKAALMNGHVGFVFAPAEVITEDVVVKAIRNGVYVQLDDIPVSKRTPAMSQALTDRDAEQQKKNHEQATERARTKASLARYNGETDPVKLQQIFDEAYASDIKFSCMFEGGSGVHTGGLKFKMDIKRRKVYTGPVVPMYGVDDLARLDQEDPTAHALLNPPKVKGTKAMGKGTEEKKTDKGAPLTKATPKKRTASKVAEEEEEAGAPKAKRARVVKA